MGKSILILIISAIMATSCRNSNANKGQREIIPLHKDTIQADPFHSTVADIVGNGRQESPVSPSLELVRAPGDTTKAVIGGGTIILTKAEFLKSVWNYEKSPQQWTYSGTKPAIIDFYADWCGPCKIASPILEEISNEYAGLLTVYKVDTQREQELAAVFGIRGIPAFLYIPLNGRPTITSGIARTKEDTKQMFVENINKLLQVKLKP